MIAAREFDLVVLDLDGTVLNPFQAGGISPAVKKSIAAVQAAGTPITIGTGRTFDMVQPYAAELGITYPVVTTQGAIVAHPVSGEVIAEQGIELTTARAVAEWIDASERVTVFYVSNTGGRTTIYQNFDALHEPRHTLELYDHLFGTPRTMQPKFRSLFEQSETRPLIKFMTVNDEECESDLTPDLQARFGSSLYITRTHPILVEGTAPGVDKGAGVRLLCEAMGVDPSRVLAIGDSDNDIPMLETVGTAVAMGNASPGVLDVADWVAPSIEEDGVAVALEKFVLSR